MSITTRKIVIILAVNLLTTFPLFYFFEEERACITDFGSRCFNQYLLRCTIQIVVLSVVMIFAMKPKKSEKQ